MKTKLLLLLLFIPFVSGYAQKIDDQETEFEFVQLPVSPLDASIRNYNSTVILQYEADIQARLDQLQADYDREMAEYPQRLQDAQERYDQIMAQYEADLKAYEEKSTTTKIVEKTILEQNNKPVKPGAFYPPSRPTLRQERHQKIFNGEMLANSYLKLEGFNKANEDAVTITATLYGFEALEPELKSVESSVYDTKTKATRKIVKYWYEVSYKHPINLNIALPTGEVIFDETFSQFAEYSLYSTPLTEGRAPNFDRDAIFRKLEDESVENNMKFINEFINSQYGFPRMTRKTTVYRIEPKKLNYDDYQQAFETISLGYNLLISEPDGATEKINAAIQIWEAALAESNPDDKKARVNADITIVTLFNLVEACVWTHDFNQAEQYLNKITALKPSKKERAIVDTYQDFIKDNKARWEANN